MAKLRPVKKRKKGKALLLFTLALTLLLALPFLISLHMRRGARILKETELHGLGADCVLVLGAGVWENGVPSHMLSDRLATALLAYVAGAAPKLLMSGDHGREDYDEVNVMKRFAIERGVPPEDVFMDHAGFSTYESLFRARDVFGAEKVLIVTQEYHLYRALYIARALGLDAYGLSADLRPYALQARYDAREFFAQSKDFLFALFQPKPRYLGQAIPLTGSGDSTGG